MGTKGAPLFIKLFLYSYESEDLDSLVKSGHRRLARSFRPCLREYLFIKNDIVFNENATIVMHLHIIFVSFSYCSLWRLFSKVIVFSRFPVDAR